MTTKTAQFTPGPWYPHLAKADHCLSSSVWGAEPGNQVAVIGGKSLQTMNANATLIAAAPAMYEALQNLLEWAKGNRGAREGNPYCKPEVRQALKVLASIQGKKDYLDADTAPQAEGQHHE